MSKLLTLLATVATLFVLSFWAPVDASPRKPDGVQNAEQTDLSARRYRRYTYRRYYVRPYGYYRSYRYGYYWPNYYRPYYYYGVPRCGYIRVLTSRNGKLIRRNGHLVRRLVWRCW
jgi:hypothetical protein